MTWELAPSLAACRAEANRIAPNRSKASDGTVGDAAHQARTSDHNVGARNRVHALDLTHDPAGGFDAHAYVERLRLSQDRRVKYLISNDRIAGPGSAAGGWAWHPYRQDDPHRNQHRHHAHISIWSTVAAETDTRTWWPKANTPFPPARGAVMVRNYLASLVAPNGGTWHLAADGGIVTDTDGLNSPEAPFYGSVPEAGGAGQARVRGILPHGDGYKVVVVHPDETVSYFHFPPR
jgi:hypothetical protein